MVSTEELTPHLQVEADLSTSPQVGTSQRKAKGSLPSKVRFGLVGLMLIAGSTWALFHVSTPSPPSSGSASLTALAPAASSHDESAAYFHSSLMTGGGLNARTRVKHANGLQTVQMSNRMNLKKEKRIRNRVNSFRFKKVTFGRKPWQKDNSIGPKQAANDAEDQLYLAQVFSPETSE